jgi:large subunit ribosomal protein L10
MWAKQRHFVLEGGGVRLAITKDRKKELVEEYRRLFEGSRGHVLTSYSGVTVADLEGLRKKLREVGGEFHIVKNSLMKLVFDEAGVDAPDDVFVGTTAIGFATDDIPAVAKAIVDLAKEGEALAVKGAIVEGQVFTRAQVERLADLPPLPVVQAQLLGVIQAPSRRMASTVASSVRQVVNVVKAFADSGAPVAETS